MRDDRSEPPTLTWVRATNEGKKQGFIPQIEGLRALAVGLVIAYHAGVPQITGGFIGVDVFFVISGFLITGLLLTELDTTGRVAFGRFFARRARRLLPAATLVLLATAAASWVILPPLRWRAVAWDTLAAAVWSGNIRSALTQIEYLTANDAPSPLLHFWSLGVEEQFYLLWPVMLSLSFAIGWRWMSARVTVAVVSALTIIGSLVVAQLWTDTRQPFAFFLLPSRAWELAAGALLATLFSYVCMIPAYVRHVLGLLGLGSIIASSVFLDSSVRWPGYAAGIPVLATAAVIISSGVTQQLLSARPMMAIGRWSYSLYLWHWPVLVLAPEALGRPLTGVETAAAVIAASAAAIGSYHVVENPLRAHRGLARSVWRSLALGSALVAVSSSAAVALHNAPLPQAPVSASTLAVGADKPPAPAPYTSLYDAAETVRYVPADLNPALLEAENDRFATDLGPCFASNPDDTAPLDGCYFGDVASTRTVALIGDSHAAQWTGALLEIAQRERFRLLILTKSACPPVQLQRASATLGAFPECRRWNASVVERLRQERPSVTLLAGYTGYAIERGLSPYEHRVLAWRALYEQLRGFTSPVLIADTPYPDLDVPVCLSANMSNVAACVQTRDAMKNGEAGRNAETDAAKDASVPVVETFDLVCPSALCPVIVGNILVYRDESHISARFAQWVNEPFSAKLLAVFPSTW